ncbi:amidohydrolase 2 [Aspergillus undulatus]|uniref:amidohydrolase 2 n=1 Tax=Aspergillus undulatus TaxID=1810928 RepID=UPI003CCDC377
MPSSSSLLPPSAFDTHVHVFDSRIGPYAEGRAYTPEDAPLESLLSFNTSISQQCSKCTIVLVQPSPYKTDCSVLMTCLQLQRQKQTTYGIAVVDLHHITDVDLEHMHSIGIRGIRLNFQADGREIDVERLAASLRNAAGRIRQMPGWMIQLFVPGWAWDALFDLVLTLPVPVIADHLGGMLGASKLSPSFTACPEVQPGFCLARHSKVIVKLSGLYRASNRTAACYDDTRPIIQAFAREIPDQCIWGSDWPHTGDGKCRVKSRVLSVKEPFRSIDTVRILENLRGWVGDDIWMKIMIENPERVFE